MLITETITGWVVLIQVRYLLWVNNIILDSQGGNVVEIDRGPSGPTGNDGGPSDDSYGAGSDSSSSSEFGK